MEENATYQLSATPRCVWQWVIVSHSALKQLIAAYSLCWKVTLMFSVSSNNLKHSHWDSYWKDIGDFTLTLLTKSINSQKHQTDVEHITGNLNAHFFVFLKLNYIVTCYVHICPKINLTQAAGTILVTKAGWKDWDVQEPAWNCPSLSKTPSVALLIHFFILYCAVYLLSLKTTRWTPLLYSFSLDQCKCTIFNNHRTT